MKKKLEDIFYPLVAVIVVAYALQAFERGKQIEHLKNELTVLKEECIGAGVKL